MSVTWTFENVIATHSGDLYRYAYWLARDRHAAEDIVQEALIRGWKGFAGLREPSSARAWLFSIVRNEFLRVVGARPPLAEDIDELEIADDRADAIGADMREALLALPAAYAEPLALQVLGGFSCAEIAAMIGTTEGATMTRLTRARQALRRMVEPGAAGSRKGGWA
jgi:RNA polymerase sigma-70 factor (ECF subfamily)